MFLLGSASLLISGAVLENRAMDEPIPELAGELHERAEGTYQASYVFCGLTAAALLATLVFYLAEEPDPGVGDDPAGLEIRF
jgi:hypothetical protein